MGYKKGYIIPCNEKDRRKAKQRKVINPIAFKPPEERVAHTILEIITKPFVDHGFWWRLIKVQKTDNYRITGMTDELFLTREDALKLKVGDTVYR